MTKHVPQIKPLRFGALLGVSLFVLSGCASVSGFTDSLSSNLSDRFNTEPAPVEAQIEASAPTALPTWSQIAPERMPTTDWVDRIGQQPLSSLVDEALAANTNVRAAAARWEAAQASAIAAGAGLKPSVNLSGRASHSEFGNSNIGDSNSLSIGPSVSWEPDLWGRISDGAKAGDIEVQASLADYAATRLSIAGSTSQSWLDLIEARLLLALAEKNLQTQDKALELTQRRFEGGVTSASDVRLARSSVASAQANVASREQLRASAARRLEILLRRYPDDSLSVATDLPRLPNLEGVGRPTDILSRRPDLIAAEQRLAGQGLRVDIARKNMLPRVTLSADGTLSGGDIADLFDIDALVGTLASSLTAPIFQGGALKAEVARNEALLRSQIESYAESILQAYLEVENALNAERQLQERETALRVSLEEAQKAEELLERRYATGLASILQLLDAQSRAINAESALISARKERLSNRVRLHLALGGGEFGTPGTALLAEYNTPSTPIGP